ncbi:hypothetical protein D3C86_767520 [compost metagenome]
MVWPNNFNSNTEEIIEIGIVRMTIKAALLSPRNNRTIKPVNTAPIAPSVTKLFTELITYTDWSNS